MAEIELGIINAAAAVDFLRQKINHQMVEAAEPLIAEALAKIEARMKKELAACLIATLEHQVSYYHNRQEIVVRLEKETGNG